MIRPRILSAVLLSLLCLTHIAAAQHTTPPGFRVGVLPFVIHSQDDMTYLGKAATRMLTSRLESPGELIVLEPMQIRAALADEPWSTVQVERARELGKGLDAQYMVAGTITKIGTSYSIDVAVISSTGIRDTQRIFLTTDDAGAIPARCAELAKRINYAILDKTMVSSVSVAGNRFIEEDAILFAIQTKPGEVFSAETLQADLKQIYQMGYFKDIRIVSADTPDGRQITFQVTEKPMVRAVQIRGNKKIKVEDIRKTMEVKPRTILNIAKIKGDIGRIRKLYTDKGYYRCEVSHTITPIDANYTSVDFIIKEGTSLKVTDVTFSGNEHVKARELRKVLETRPKHWLLSLFTNIGVFKDEAVQKDIDRLTGYYYSKGYLQVNVDRPEVVFDDDGIRIHFTITEGQRYTIGTIGFKGDLIFDTGALAEAIKSKEGATFNGRTLNDDLVKIKAMYAEQGHAYADVSPLTDLDPEQLNVNLLFDIQKGEIIYIEHIKIIGNTRTRDNVIRREMRLVEGAVFNSEQIKRSKQEINNLGFFEKVDINTEPGSASNLVKLTVDVKERPTGSFSVGAGYSSVDSIMGMFQISQNNLFGKGQRLTFMAQVGGHSGYYNISFTEPWFRDTRTSVGFDLFSMERVYEEFDRESKGLNLRASWPLDDYWDFTRFHLTYRYEDIDIKDLNYNEGVSVDIQEQEGSNSVSSIISAIIMDSRDDRWAPRSGLYRSLSFEFAGLGGDSRFMTLIAQAGKWFPLPKDTAFMVRGTIGQIVPYGGKGVPISERFFLGGMDSMRGFEVRSLGPYKPRPWPLQEYNLFGRKFTYQKPGFMDKYDCVGGKKELYFNFEYLFPIMPSSGVRGYVFVDAGNAYRTGESFFSEMRYSSGLGVKWWSPFGPLELVWGINLNARSKYDEDRSNFEFSMGRMF